MRRHVHDLISVLMGSLLAAVLAVDCRESLEIGRLQGAMAIIQEREDGDFDHG